MFGVGCWRAMRRFGVEQGDDIRACDDAKENLRVQCSIALAEGLSAQRPVEPVAGGTWDMHRKSESRWVSALARHIAT